MATLRQKIAAEHKVRELLKHGDVPAPDRIEYGFTCIRLYWLEPKVVLVVDIDEFSDERDDPANHIDVFPRET
jgi:hypothetical protein